jgi:hypothetical protein
LLRSLERTETAPPEAPGKPAERPGGLGRDILHLYTRPGALFADLPRSNHLGGALLVLLLLYALYAGLLLSTGVPDYEIEAQAQKEISRAALQLKGEDNSEELARKVDGLEKQATFNRLFSRILLLLGGPVRLLLGVGVLASVLFLAVSFWGAAKPDFAQLAGVVVFASFALVPRLLLRLLLVSQLQVMRVETSAAALLPSLRSGLGAYLLLRRLDPFEVWYWALVGLGLWKTGQMSGRRAAVAALLLALLAGLCQACLDLGDLAEYRGELIKAE